MPPLDLCRERQGGTETAPYCDKREKGLFKAP